MKTTHFQEVVGVGFDKITDEDFVLAGVIVEHYVLDDGSHDLSIRKDNGEIGRVHLSAHDYSRLIADADDTVGAS